MGEDFSPLGILKPKKSKKHSKKPSLLTDEVFPHSISQPGLVLEEKLDDDRGVAQAATIQKAKKEKRCTAVPGPLEQECSVGALSPPPTPEDKADSSSSSRVEKPTKKGKKAKKAKKAAKASLQGASAVQPDMPQPELRSGDNDGVNWGDLKKKKNCKKGEKDKTAQPKRVPTPEPDPATESFLSPKPVSSLERSTNSAASIQSAIQRPRISCDIRFPSLLVSK